MREKQKLEEKTVDDFLAGKSEHTLALYNHFLSRYRKVGKIEVRPTKTMIAISGPRKGIAYITQLGRNFVHVVLLLDKLYPDNLCFQKIGQVPGQNQFNHHFRMLEKEDVNGEVLKFMKLALKLGS